MASTPKTSFFAIQMEDAQDYTPPSGFDDGHGRPPPGVWQWTHYVGPPPEWTQEGVIEMATPPGDRKQEDDNENFPDGSHFFSLRLNTSLAYGEPPPAGAKRPRVGASKLGMIRVLRIFKK